MNKGLKWEKKKAVKGGCEQMQVNQRRRNDWMEVEFAVMSYKLGQVDGRLFVKCLADFPPHLQRRFLYFALLYLLSIPENQGPLGSI